AALARPPHGGGDLADGYRFRLLAGNRARHELEQILAGARFSRKNAEALPADNDLVSLANLGHGDATRRTSLRVDQNTAIHLLIFDIDPFAAETDLRAMIGGAVERFGEGTVHV